MLKSVNRLESKTFPKTRYEKERKDIIARGNARKNLPILISTFLFV
jgi:hypothetical protein